MDDDPRGAPPEIRPPGLLHRVRRHLIDLTPLRHSSDLRRLMLAQAVSEFGNQATLVAIPLQVYTITRSTVAVGLIGLAELVPNLLLAPLGGAIADTVDRRRLTLLANAVFAVLSVGLVANALLADPLLWALYAFATLAALSPRSPSRASALGLPDSSQPSSSQPPLPSKELRTTRTRLSDQLSPAE